jgi:hypothetical protein
MFEYAENESVPDEILRVRIIIVVDILCLLRIDGLGELCYKVLRKITEFRKGRLPFCKISPAFNVFLEPGQKFRLD